MRTPLTILSMATALVSSPLLAQSISHSGDKSPSIRRAFGHLYPTQRIKSYLMTAKAPAVERLQVEQYF